jgi:CelD/BcsL family acetyltransferase involved in cellulose biosynthesis
MSEIRAHILTGFDDPRIAPDEWTRLLSLGSTDVIFLTRQYLRAWWETLGQGKLLLILAERDGQPLAFAPLYAADGMIFFAASDSADYLDFIGDTSDPEILRAILAAAMAAVPDFLGFKFYFIPEPSRTSEALHRAAASLGLSPFLMGEIISPVIDMKARAEDVGARLRRSMLTREEKLRRHGPLVVRQETDIAAIREKLGSFYALHIARWESRGIVSQFTRAAHRGFLERSLELVAELGGSRFLWLEWKGEFLAGEIDWYYRGTHYSGPWTFSLEHARFSPGQVLLRQSLLAAQTAGLHSYDLGIGPQDYKLRLPVHTINCQTWGLYPPG